jgi:hypothetical protein
MTETVQSDIAIMVKNQLKRKKEDEKLAAAKRTVEDLKSAIAKLKTSN